MNTDVEQLLREGMERLAAVTAAPVGLVGRARRRQRRRRLAMISAATGAAAAITAVAVVTVAGVGRPARTVSRAQTTAYVTGRVDNAVAALATANLVLRTETTFSPAFPAITQWSYRQDFRAVQSGLMHGTGLPWAQGQVSFADGTATIGGKRVYVQADYRHHQWYLMPPFGVVPSACTSLLDLAEFNSVDWPGYVRRTLACGKFTVAGHAWVNGRKTLKITGSMTERAWWLRSPHAASRGAMHVEATFYVDPSTYLPVRAMWINWTHAAGGRLLRGTVRQDFLLLPPTPRNIARATVTIPAGFRKVQRFAFGGPVGRFFG
jgi:hypothetical protein